jgi:hypothetical protein
MIHVCLFSWCVVRPVDCRRKRCTSEMEIVGENVTGKITWLNSLKLLFYFSTGHPKHISIQTLQIFRYMGNWHNQWFSFPVVSNVVIYTKMRSPVIIDTTCSPSGPPGRLNSIQPGITQLYGQRHMRWQICPTLLWKLRQLPLPRVARVTTDRPKTPATQD